MNSSAALENNGYASQPPAEDKPGLVDRPSYDQVVNWWNALEENQRQAMRNEGSKLSRHALDQLRYRYAQYYPNEIYPREVYVPGELSTSDCSILFHFSDDLLQQKNWGNLSWYTQELQEAFQPLPPAYYAIVPPAGESEEKAIPSAPPPSYEEAAQQANEWINNLPPQQREQIHAEAARLRPQIHIIHQRLSRYPGYRVIDANRLTDIDLYLMFHHADQFNNYIWFKALQTTFQLGAKLTELTLRGTWALLKLGFQTMGAAAKGAGSVLRRFGSRGSGRREESSNSNGNNNGSSSARNAGVGLAILAAIVAALATAAAGFVYAFRKMKSSLANLTQGKKVGRSRWRLAWITGGGLGGAYGGLFLGILAASIIFPGAGGVGVVGGIGEMILGAAIGSIVCSGVFAAVGAAIGKYTAQFYSWLKTGTTNPERYDSVKALKNMQQNGIERELQGQGLVLNTQLVKEVLKDAENSKRQFESKAKGKPEQAEKKQYNHFTDALVKKGKNLAGPVRVDEMTVMFWNRGKHEIAKTQMEMPHPVGGLTR